MSVIERAVMQAALAQLWSKLTFGHLPCLWRRSLLVIAGLRRGPPNTLTAIHQFALVSIERGLDFLFRVVPRVLVRPEFRATVFANANDPGRGDPHDPP